MGYNVDEEDRERGVENHLEDGVDSDEDGAVFLVAACKTGPDEDLEETNESVWEYIWGCVGLDVRAYHCDAARQPDEDEAVPEARFIG